MARREFRRELREEKKIMFSSEIVHFDGISFQKAKDKEDGTYQMIDYDPKLDGPKS